MAVLSSSDTAPFSLDASQEDVESTLTDRYQTTVPQPERLQPISTDLVARLRDLVSAIEVDLDAALPDEEPASR